MGLLGTSRPSNLTDARPVEDPGESADQQRHRCRHRRGRPTCSRPMPRALRPLISLVRTLAGWTGGGVDRLAGRSTPRIGERGPELVAGRLPKLALQKLRASRKVRLGQPPASLRAIELDQTGVRRLIERRQRDEPACGLDRRLGIPRRGLEIDQPGEGVGCQLAEPVALGSASTPRSPARGPRAPRRNSPR